MTQRCMSADWSGAVLRQYKELLPELGHARVIREGLSDRQAAGLFSHMCLSAMIHLIAGLLSLPSAMHGWEESGQLGHLGFFTASFVILGWSFFAAVDDFLRCFLPSTEGLSGLACPCPRSYWALMAFTYHPFWLTLILPANELNAGTSSYHMLVCCMTLGGGVQYSARLLALILEAKRSGVLYRMAIVSGFVAAIFGRVFLFFPSTIELVRQMHAHTVASGDMFLMSALLTSCFNVAAVLDAIKSMMWGTSIQNLSSNSALGSQSRPLRSGAKRGTSTHIADDTDSSTLEMDGRPSAAGTRGRTARKPKGAKRGEKHRAKRGLSDEDEMVFGFTADDIENADTEDGDHSNGGTQCKQENVIDDDGNFVDGGIHSRPSNATGGKWSPPSHMPAHEEQPNRAQTDADTAASVRQKQVQQEVEDARNEIRQQQQQQKQQKQQQKSKQQPSRATQGAQAQPTMPAAQEIKDLGDLYSSGRLNSIGHYNMLGIGKAARPEEIKRAFHQLSRKWHPDKKPDDAERAAAIFKGIKESYECLSDPIRRKRYDKFFAP